MKKLLLISSLVLSSTAFSYTYRERQIYDIGSPEWKQQLYEEEQEEKQKRLEERLENLEKKQEEAEETVTVWDFSDEGEIEDEDD